MLCVKERKRFTSVLVFVSIVWSFIFRTNVIAAAQIEFVWLACFTAGLLLASRLIQCFYATGAASTTSATGTSSTAVTASPTQDFISSGTDLLLELSTRDQLARNGSLLTT